MDLRVIVVGLGVQGQKRRRFAGDDCVAAIDIRHPDAAFRDLDAVPLEAFDAALVCVPDAAKVPILDYLISHGKHVLVEKPLIADEEKALLRLEQAARERQVVCYVAYNHRFEPHFVRMRDVIASGELGRLYHCRLFYGNGTARLVRDSDWRDQGAGVIHDLGSHLLDTARFFFGDIGEDVELLSVDRFENRAPDHAAFAAPRATPRLAFEVTLVSWRNDFGCDLFAENGSAHIRSLCKWGPSAFVRRRRVVPSGRPPEEQLTLIEEDPTWAREYQHFKGLCRTRPPTDLGNDIWLNRMLRRLGEDAQRRLTR
jgi:scyllo-inositol 2-dehydrogenase (NADP+)